MVLGLVSGAVMGLFFHREGWLGGYGSFPRRLLRLGHIAFFALGFLTVLYAVGTAILESSGWITVLGGWGLVTGAFTMGPICFWTAYWKSARHFFPIPVTGVALGLMGGLFG